MELAFLLDTNTLIYIRRSKPKSVREAFDKVPVGETAISIITFGELVFGVMKSSQREGGMKQLEQLSETIPVLPLPQEAGNFYGSVRAELEASGQSIGNNDLWIAAHALALGLTLVTNNEKEFRRVRGLKIANWTR